MPAPDLLTPARTQTLAPHIPPGQAGRSHARILLALTHAQGLRAPRTPALRPLVQGGQREKAFGDLGRFRRRPLTPPFPRTRVVRRLPRLPTNPHPPQSFPPPACGGTGIRSHKPGAGEAAKGGGGGIKG